MIWAGIKLLIRPSQRIGGVVGRESFLVLDQLGICMDILFCCTSGSPKPICVFSTRSGYRMSFQLNPMTPVTFRSPIPNGVQANEDTRYEPGLDRWCADQSGIDRSSRFEFQGHATVFFYFLGTFACQRFYSNPSISAIILSFRQGTIMLIREWWSGEPPL